MSDASRRFPYRIERRGDVTILHCAATHYHADSYAPLAAALAEAVEQAPEGRLVVDLAPVVLFSSTALRALRTAHQALDARGGRIVTAGGGELVHGVLKFAPFIRHVGTLEEAVALFHSEPRRERG